MSTLGRWIRILALAVAGGGLGLLIQHWTDGRPWSEAGTSAVLLAVVVLVIGLASQRSHRNH